MAEDMLSLLSLQAELTCRVCSSAFENPMRLPCGHNFCQSCLEESWKDTFPLFCPQCRYHYPSKPELKKNTALSAVLESFKKKSSTSHLNYVGLSVNTKELEVMKCDSCMVANAFKTCLTCMASFCEEHVKPHLVNPIFRPHQLTDPVGDLQEQICQDHNKIMEFFCKKHDYCICAACMQQFHRGCEYTTTDDIRVQKESEMMSTLHLLDRKIDKNNLAMVQVREQQLQLQDDADCQKTMLTTEYQFIRDLIDKAEQDALRAIDKDLESGQTRIQSFMKKFGKNVEKMSDVKMELHSLLSRADSLSFLEASLPLASSIMYDPCFSHVNTESTTLMAHQCSAVAVKGLLTKIMSLPVENRFSLLKPGQTMEATDPTSVPLVQCKVQNRARRRRRHGKTITEKRDTQSQEHLMVSTSKKNVTPGQGTLSKGMMETAGPNVLIPVQQATRSRARSQRRKGNKEETSGERGALNQQLPGLSLSQTNLTLQDSSPNKEGGQTVTIPHDVSTAKKRSDLLKFSTVLKLDPRTAHKRIVLTEDFTKALIAEEPCQYADGPERFTVCSQVLCSQSFEQGCHYWEVKISKNKCCCLGLGLAYGSMDRKGPCSRLGFNSSSWCVEWFNDKLSAWHDGVERVLGVPGPGRIGILLDCDDGFATFYAVADLAYPFHTFELSLREAIYPAFFIISASSSISLCKLT